MKECGVREELGGRIGFGDGGSEREGIVSSGRSGLLGFKVFGSDSRIVSVCFFFQLDMWGPLVPPVGLSLSNTCLLGGQF